jgi:chromosome segregation ATPase
VDRLATAVRAAYIALDTEKGGMVADFGQAVLEAIADLKTGIERRFTAVEERLTGVEQRLTGVEGRLTGIEATLLPMRAQLDGLPFINRAVTTIQQEVRAVRAAFNDFALTNPTVGEIQALHHDVNRVQAENAELAHKVATLERLVRELQEP